MSEGSTTTSSSSLLSNEKLDKAVLSFNKRFDTEEQPVNAIPANALSTPLDVTKAMTELGSKVLQRYGTQWLLKHKQPIPLGLTQDPGAATVLEGNTSSAQRNILALTKLWSIGSINVSVLLHLSFGFDAFILSPDYCNNSVVAHVTFVA